MDDIFNVDIDPSILLSYELDKLTLDNQVDVESVLLSVENNKVGQTTNTSPKDTKHQDFKIFDTNVRSVAEEITRESEQDGRKDYNGNEDSLSNENLNHRLDNSDSSESDSDDLSDSDNEAVGDEDSSDLTKRGPVGRRVTKRKNRTNYLERNERYDRSQFPAGSLQHWSVSTVVQQAVDDPVAINQTPILNINEAVQTSSSSNDSVSSPSSVVSDYVGASSAYGSPESGYDSSITGSPPEVSSLAGHYHGTSNLVSIPEIEDINDLWEFENIPECALNGRNVLRCDPEDREKINEIINFLKDIPDELLNEPSDACSGKVCVPSVNNSHDINASSGNNGSSCLKNVEIRKKEVIKFKLQNRAKTKLRQSLSTPALHSTLFRMYRQINDDKANAKPIKIIKVVDEVDGTSENRTNLHHAVIDKNIEEIFCLVEIQKQYDKPLPDINIRDKNGKTALDYAVQQDMTLVVDYLKENTAIQSVRV